MSERTLAFLTELLQAHREQLRTWRKLPARVHGVFGVADQAELYLHADKGYVGGAGATLLTPYKGRNLPDSARQANRCHAAVRATGERGFAVLKTWKIFGRFRSCPRQVGAFARAVLTLEHSLQ